MPGNMWDEPEEAPQQDLDLKLLRVGAQPIDDFLNRLRTPRNDARPD
ncbi:MAG: hypothetical protein IPH65_17730 [Dehalococcoidia bacterium]|nr:hypothetical protein [Dehalococcoidia bacterium]